MEIVDLCLKIMENVQAIAPILRVVMVALRVVHVVGVQSLVSQERERAMLERLKVLLVYSTTEHML